MSDRRLQVFHAVVKYGSFTRAAEHLFMTQPAVTFQIKQIEEHFNTRLLDRGHGKVSPTPAGWVVYDYAERILDLSDELDVRISELTDELRGELAIGTSTTIADYWLPELLSHFCAQYPKVTPTVVVGNSQLTVERVASRELDVGFIEIISTHAALEQYGVARDELMMICAPNHPLAAGQGPVDAQTLLEHTFVNRDPGNAIRDLAEAFFRASGVAPADIPQCAAMGALAGVKAFVACGHGYGIASAASTRREVNARELVARPLSPPQYTPFEIILPKDRFRSRLINVFAGFATDKLADMATVPLAPQPV